MSDFPLPDPAATEAVVKAQALDIQHDTDPADDHGIARRIPHLGHAAFFLAIMGFSSVLVPLVTLISLRALTPAAMFQHPFAIAASAIGGYIMTFAITIPVFPFFWHRSFFEGIHWTWRQVQLHWWKLILIGLSLSVIAQLLELLIKSPVESDVTQLLKTPLAAWTTVVLGVLIGPFAEEVAFRGFLLPAFATAYDWLSLERTPAGLDRWQRTTAHSIGALIFGTIASSIPFVALHGGQLHWAKAPLAILFVMSLAFSAVRIRTRSVAASTLVHISYNALLFAEVIYKTHGFHHLEKM